jgi:UvrD/REP helicase N-terminal domain
MDRALFLDLVNEVLKIVGREPLAAGGSEQKIICVLPEDRVLQILAGPGSGKTEMLVWRVLYELFVVAIKSERVMVTTFTRRAATELQVRVVERSDALMAAAARRGISVGDPLVHDLRIGTIHGLCDSLLAEFDDTYAASGTDVIDETEIRVRLARDYRWALGFSYPAPKRVLNRLFENQRLMRFFASNFTISRAARRNRQRQCQLRYGGWFSPVRALCQTLFFRCLCGQADSTNPDSREISETAGNYRYCWHGLCFMWMTFCLEQRTYNNSKSTQQIRSYSKPGGE